MTTRRLGWGLKLFISNNIFPNIFVDVDFLNSRRCCLVKVLYSFDVRWFSNTVCGVKVTWRRIRARSDPESLISESDLESRIYSEFLIFSESDVDDFIYCVSILKIWIRNLYPGLFTLFRALTSPPRVSKSSTPLMSPLWAANMSNVLPYWQHRRKTISS